MKSLIVDLDNTLTIDSSHKNYAEKQVNLKLLEKLIEYKSLGFKIVIFTARNMRTYNGDTDLIEKNTAPVIIKWLNDNSVPYDELIVGKPWCGEEGFHIDDRAIRPSEFIALSKSGVQKLLDAERLNDV